jgi:hypothetical protein
VDKLTDGNYLFQTPPTAGAAFTALTVGFGLLFVLCAVAYWRRGKLAPENPVLRRLIRRVATAGMWSAGIGLFLALMRYAQIPYVSMPFLMYLLLLSMIGVVAYFVYDLSERYPLAMWKLQESHIERQYRPAPKPRREPQRQRPAVRGKRRR